jgi:DNA-binding MarR family transcriptional regulator
MLIQQSETAINAYHDHVPKIIPHQQQVILDVLDDNCEYTIGELAALTGLDKSAVSGRRNQMLKDGLIERGATRKCFRSGIVCETVRLPTPMQLEFTNAKGFSHG